MPENKTSNSILSRYEQEKAARQKEAEKIRRGRPSIYGLDRLAVGEQIVFPLSWSKQVNRSAEAQRKNNGKSFLLETDENARTITVTRLENDGPVKESFHEPKRRRLAYPWDELDFGETRRIPLDSQKTKLSLVRSLNIYKRQNDKTFSWEEIEDPDREGEKMLWVKRTS